MNKTTKYEKKQKKQKASNYLKAEWMSLCTALSLLINVQKFHTKFAAAHQLTNITVISV